MPYFNLIPWTISAISLLFCILTFARNGRTDVPGPVQSASYDGESDHW